MKADLNIWDVLAIILYFALVLAAGIYAMCKSKRSTVSGYFLAGRFMTWLPVGASVFASNIGSEHFVGLAGSGAASGIAVGAFELNALLLLQLLGWIFLPVYIASKVSTLPEYMSKRFGGKRIRIFLAVLSLILYIFTKLSVNLFSGAIFIKETLGWDLYLSIFLLLVMTCLCTITGGLAAVIYTDTLQCFIMIIGATLLMVKSFYAVGGISGLKEKYMESIPNVTIANTTCGFPREDSWEMLRDPVGSDMPWPGFILGQTPASIWYWCADQLMVQRTLAAKSISHAQGATLFAGYLKILPLFLIVLPGMISRVLFTDVVACVDPDLCEKYCGSRLGCSNLAYPKLVLEIMPTGLRGVMLAVMLAALMSDLTSIFNSSSTLFTMDIWTHIRKRAKSKELLIVGKVFVLFMVVVSVAWVPVILEMQGGQLFIYIQAISAYLAPPIAAMYLCAVLWKRLNEKGAFWALMTGFSIGIVRMILDFTYREPACGEPDNRPAIIKHVHYMYFAMLLFWVTIGTAVVISLWTLPLDDKRLTRTTYWTRFDENVREDEKKIDEMPLRKLSKGVSQNCQSDNIKVDHRNDESQCKEDDGQTEEAKSKWKVAYDWFCGYEADGESEMRVEEMQLHLERLSSLKQPRTTKTILTVNLGIILVVGSSLYIFFTFIMPRL